LKSWPTVMDVTMSGSDTLNAMAAPCDVVPVHSPA
jgi:hypothetical protein